MILDITPIYDDPRRIQSIWFDGSRHIEVGGGSPRVEEIVAYREPGMGSYTAWLAIVRRGVITARVPAWQVHIIYA